MAAWSEDNVLAVAGGPAVHLLHVSDLTRGRQLISLDAAVRPRVRSLTCSSCLLYTSPSPRD